MIKNKILVVENDDVNSSNIKDYFKQTNYVDGMVAVIDAVGHALKDHFPYDRITDENELSDEIMIGKWEK